jgi:hypothetical protein
MKITKIITTWSAYLIAWILNDKIRIKMIKLS